MSARRVAATAFVAGVVIAGAAAGSARANLVTNGSFEGPDIPTGTYAIFANPQVPGWTHAPRAGVTSFGIEIQDHNIGAPAPGAGDQFVEFDSDGPALIWQDVATTPGLLYRLSFLYSPRPNTAAAQNHFSADFGSASVTMGPLGSGTQTDWQTRTLDLIAADSTTRVSFLDLSPEESPGNGLGAYVDLVSVEAVNRAPDCSGVSASPNTLRSPDHAFVPVALNGATDPDGDTVTISIDGVTQDEPVDGLADGSTTPDAAAGSASNEVLVRAERSGLGDGRVYRIAYTASDGNGSACVGTAIVGVPHNQASGAATDSGDSYDSFGS